MGDISKHFNRAEFACKDGCGFDTVDAELLAKLEEIREHFDQPVIINSACRCHDHNAVIGGTENSQHLIGRAADIVVKNTPVEVVREFAEQIGIGGMGEYNTFVHIDTRVGYARW